MTTTFKTAASLFASTQSPFVLFVLLAIGRAGFPSVGNAEPPTAEAHVAGNNFLSLEAQKTFDAQVQPFLKKYCINCHGTHDNKAGLRLDILGTDFLEGKTANVWKEVIDKLNVGAMPPKDEEVPRPNAKDSFVLVEWVNQEIRNAEKRAQSTGGRVAMRRMNRTEYANTVRDLFYLDDNFARKIERELPGDGKVDGFDRGGAALLVDKSQLQVYMDVAELVVDEALPLEKPKTRKHRLEASKDSWLTHVLPKRIKLKNFISNSELGFANDLRYLFNKEELEREVETGTQVNDFTIQRDGGLEVSVSSNTLGYYGRLGLAREVVKTDGVYRCRIRAGASRGSGKYAVDEVRVKADYCERQWNRTSLTFTIDAPLDEPKLYEQDIYLQSGGPDFDRVLQLRWNSFYNTNGYGDTRSPLFMFDDGFYTSLQAINRAGHNLERALGKEPPEKLEALRNKRDAEAENFRQYMLKFEGPICLVKPDVDFNALPRIWYEFIELEGPFAEWPTKANQEILVNSEEGDVESARQIFSRFLPRAYRRPVGPDEVEDLVKAVSTKQTKLGMTFAQAARATIASVLSSPDFLYLQEPTGEDTQPRELKDYELATRLSYLLWNSMPDEALFELAAQKKLNSPAVVRDQVRRMAADPKARHFVESFVGQWMKVREFDSVMVDTRFQYKDYDEALRKSGQSEPFEFFHELLRANLSVLNVLDSDFVVINERLAKHYGIDGVEGENFRRVAITPEQHRGGILGMAGVLTYLSDGFRTTPVKRGAYVLDVLWNTPAPLPPPDAGDLPPVKNAKTVRERLEQHRNRDVCASCHVKIDPLGLGLENYDAIGAWRERQNGEGRKGDAKDPPIDSSGIMPNGKPFANLSEYKQALFEEKERFLKSFTEKLLAYALGRPIGVTDRAMIERIIGKAADEGYHLQEFVQALVVEREFRTK